MPVYELILSLPLIEDTPQWHDSFDSLKTRCRARKLKAPRSPPEWDGQKGNPQGDGVDYEERTQNWCLVRRQWDPLYPDDPTKHSYWPPGNTKLTDFWVYLALKFLPPHKRRRFVYDFTSKGDVRTDRVPRGDPVVVEAHGVPWVVVFRGYYMFVGERGANRGWLLNSEGHSRTVVNRWPSNKLVIGLVVASREIIGDYVPRKIVCHAAAVSTVEHQRGWECDEWARGKADMWVSNADDVLDLNTGRVIPRNDLPGLTKKCQATFAADHTGVIQGDIMPTSSTAEEATVDEAEGAEKTWTREIFQPV